MKNEENKMRCQPICMAVGIGLGMAVGAVFDKLPIGMSIGVGLGLAVGGIMDHIRNKEK